LGQAYLWAGVGDIEVVEGDILDHLLLLVHVTLGQRHILLRLQIKLGRKGIRSAHSLDEKRGRDEKREDAADSESGLSAVLFSETYILTPSLRNCFIALPHLEITLTAPELASM
jgi:hypothetical protein